MIVAVDVETQGLDSTKFIIGCILKDNGKYQFYRKPQELWEDLLELGQKEAKRGKLLKVYSHNANFDFFSYANKKDKNITIYNTNPFIVSYDITFKGKKKTTIRFLDTLPLYRMSLEKAGELIGIPKLETPEYFKTGQPITEIQIENSKDYLLRDTEICLKLYNTMYNKIQSLGLKIKRIFTIHQIAIQYMMHQLLKQTRPYLFIQQQFKTKTIQKQFHWTRNKEEIHQAYRGGWVEAFQTGIFQDTTLIDCNSAYAYSASNMQFPDLSTERLVKQPLEIYTRDELLKTIGISEVTLYNNSNPYGPIPVRTPEEDTYHPKIGSYIIGWYTNIEIQNAIKNGYYLLNIDKSVLFNQAPENPMKPILEDLYQRRIQSNDPFDKYFFKQMMNSSFGKMAQNRPLKEYKLDSVEKSEHYFNKGYKAINNLDYDYLYMIEKPQKRFKNYYAPIIPTLTNAYARIHMFQNMRKIKPQDVLYTDTDSLLFKGNYLNKFKLSDKLGSFKLETQKQQAIIYGKKTYMIGKKIKISGFTKKDITTESFKKGLVHSRRLNTINTAKNLTKVGTSYEIQRNLKQQQNDYEKTQKMLKKRNLYIDAHLKEYIQHIKKIGET